MGYLKIEQGQGRRFWNPPVGVSKRIGTYTQDEQAVELVAAPAAQLLPMPQPQFELAPPHVPQVARLVHELGPTQDVALEQDAANAPAPLGKQYLFAPQVTPPEVPPAQY